MFEPNNCYPCMLYHSKLSGGYIVVKTAEEHKAVLEHLEPKIPVIEEKPKAKKATKYTIEGL